MRKEAQQLSDAIQDYVDETITHLLKVTNKIETNTVAKNTLKVKDIDIEQMLIHNRVAKHMFSDYRDLILVLPEKTRPKFKKLEDKEWVIFTKNTDVALAINKNFMKECGVYEKRGTKKISEKFDKKD